MGVLLQRPPDRARYEADSESLQQRIYVWSTHLPAWQRDLLRRLAAGPLSEADVDEVLAILADAPDAPAARSLRLSDLPADRPATEQVELREISDVRNINLLAGGQSLRFRPGLNIVFGKTGAGKSSYGRLLQRLSGATTPVKVLCNVFDGESGGTQTASVRVAVGSEERDIAVDLAGKTDPDLASIAVFDSSSAPRYVSKPNVIEHIPQCLVLLRRLVEAHSVLRERLKEQLAELRLRAPRLPEVDPRTVAGKLVSKISDQTDPEEVTRFATLSLDERSEMEALGMALATVGSTRGDEAEAVGQAFARAAQGLIDALTEATEKLADGRLSAIRRLRAGLDEATAAERTLAGEAFTGEPYSGTGQGPWRDLWEAARRFVEAEGASFPPLDRDAACPLCQGDLDDGARERMEKFEEFVGSDLRRKIAGLNQDISREVKELPDLAAVKTRVEAYLFGAPTEVTTAAGEVVDALAERAELARRCANGPLEEAVPLAPPPDLTPIRAYAEHQARAAEARAGIRDETMQQQMVDRLAELRARDALAAAPAQLQAYIAWLKQIDHLTAAKSALITTKISSQLRALQESVLIKRLPAAIIEELERLRLLQGRLSLVGKATKGKGTIQLLLKDAPAVGAEEVLSDGEQRAVALAFFLGERAVDTQPISMVLDDPLGLLDHERRRYVVGRLIEASRNRQVIVFTHDLDAVEMFRQAARDAGREIHGQTLQRAFDQAGIAIDELPDLATAA